MIRTLHEKILTTDSLSFSLFREHGELINCEYHTHPEFELTFVRSGFGTLFVNSDILLFQPGMLTLFGSDLPHHYVNRPPGADVFGIQFRSDFAGSCFMELPELARVRRMLRESASGLRFSAAAAKSCAPILETLFDPVPPPMRKLTGFLNILDLLAESEWTRISSVPEFDTGEADPRIVKAIGLIQNNVARNLSFTLADVAAKAGLSPDVFSRYFSRVTKKSCRDYVIELRIGKAAKKLRDTEQGIAEICFECGFRNLSNFNRIFRKLKGTTPSRFRARYRSIS